MTRVQFDATLDEFVDATLRALARSRSARSWRWADNLAGIAISGLGAGLALFFLLPVLFPDAEEDGLVVGCLGAAAAGILSPFAQRRIVKRRLYQHFREALGGNGPFSVEVELAPAGVFVKQKSGQLSLDWSQVEAIQETNDSVDILPRHAGILVVRKRAFGSNAEMQQFIEEAESYRTQAQNTAPA